MVSPPAEIYTLSLHDALPISSTRPRAAVRVLVRSDEADPAGAARAGCRRARARARSEEHTSELQSQSNLVCRLLLEKKNRYASFPTDAAPPCRGRCFYQEDAP